MPVRVARCPLPREADTPIGSRAPGAACARRLGSAQYDQAARRHRRGAALPGWRNGRRSRLKICFPYGKYGFESRPGYQSKRKTAFRRSSWAAGAREGHPRGQRVPADTGSDMRDSRERTRHRRWVLAAGSRCATAEDAEGRRGTPIADGPYSRWRPSDWGPLTSSSTGSTTCTPSRWPGFCGSCARHASQADSTRPGFAHRIGLHPLRSSESSAVEACLSLPVHDPMAACIQAREGSSGRATLALAARGCASGRLLADAARRTAPQADTFYAGRDGRPDGGGWLRQRLCRAKSVGAWPVR